MKKYLIHFMSADQPSIDDDGISSGTNFGICKETFDTKEEADNYLMETLIPEDQANLEQCYGFDEDEEPWANIEVENGCYDRKELNVYDKHDGYLINSTIYEIVEVEF